MASILGMTAMSEPPSLRPVWVPDQAVARCQQCESSFTAFRRRHHCRACGHVFCQSCTSNKIQLTHLGYEKPVRVCNACFRQVQRREQPQPIFGSTSYQNKGPAPPPRKGAASMPSSSSYAPLVPSLDPSPISSPELSPRVRTLTPREALLLRAYISPVTHASSPSILVRNGNGLAEGPSLSAYVMTRASAPSYVPLTFGAGNRSTAELQLLNTHNPFLQLPDDLILRILSNLNRRDLYSISCTCARLYSLSFNNGLWALIYCSLWDVSVEFVQSYYVDWRQIVKERISRDQLSLTFVRNTPHRKKKFFQKRDKYSESSASLVDRKSGGGISQASSTTNGIKGTMSPRAGSYSEDLRIDLRTAIQRDGANVVMFGPTGVGKTTLAFRFAKEDFVTPETSTGALYFNRSVKVKERLIRLRLIDFAGGEKYWCLAPLYYNQAHVLVFVYDITQPATFEAVKDMIREYRVRALATPSGGGSSNTSTSNATILALVGTKLDLASQRKVSVEEARMLGIKESMEICLEASSRTGEGVEELFQEIATLIMFLT